MLADESLWALLRHLQLLLQNRLRRVVWKHEIIDCSPFSVKLALPDIYDPVVGSPGLLLECHWAKWIDLPFNVLLVSMEFESYRQNRVLHSESGFLSRVG